MTLPTGYFDAMYAAVDDPWSLAFVTEGCSDWTLRYATSKRRRGSSNTAR